MKKKILITLALLSFIVILIYLRSNTGLNFQNIMQAEVIHLFFTLLTVQVMCLHHQGIFQ